MSIIVISIIITIITNLFQFGLKTVQSENALWLINTNTNEKIIEKSNRDIKYK